MHTRRSLSALGALLIATGSSLAGTLAAPTSAARPAMGVRVLSVIAPSVIAKNAQPITVHVRVTGIRLDPTHIGRKNVAGRGHMQIYLDRIPASAYRTPNLRDVVAIAAGPIFTFVLSPQWKRAGRGHHRYVIALAQNNEVLYHAGTASFRLTVK